MTARLLLGDCIEQMKQLPDASIDAVVTDPPYGIGFMGHDWDQPDRAVTEREGVPSGQRRASQPAPSGHGRDGRAMEAGRYDLSRSANQVFQAWTEEWAREAFRVLKPGGHLLSFASTRTYHRMTSGIEDAGFEIRDTLAWMFGSGFPKSRDVGKAIDSEAGAEREVISDGERSASRPHVDGQPQGKAYRLGSADVVTAPATEDAERWQGWGTALKPAFEPIAVARKPLIGTVAANVLEHGTGAINVDGCRIAFASADDETESKSKNRHADFGSGPRENDVYGTDDRTRAELGNYDAPGRWPANVLLGHHEDCVEVGVTTIRGSGHTPASRPSSTFQASAQDENEERSWASERVPVYCHPECPIRLLDTQTGDRPGFSGGGTRGAGFRDAYVGGEPHGGVLPAQTFGDSGGASRFFYCAKTSRAERSAGLDGFEKRDLDWSSGDANPGAFQGEGTDRSARNHHPTVKPIDVMRWLARLVTPPGGTVLDPFLGSGTTGIACGLEGFEFVGIEREAEYMAISEARIRFWAEHGEDGLRICAEREQANARRAAAADAGQLDLFAV